MVRFPVSGMICNSCVTRITRALRKVGGVTKVRVDLGRGTVTVRREPELASNSALTAAVAEAGYEADLESALVVAGEERRSLIDRLLGRPA